jgi:hypothetical protein
MRCRSCPLKTNLGARGTNDCLRFARAADLREAHR